MLRSTVSVGGKCQCSRIDQHCSVTLAYLRHSSSTPAFRVPETSGQCGRWLTNLRMRAGQLMVGEEDKTDLVARIRGGPHFLRGTLVMRM